jgi:YXWGXW repeat-containing protein
MGETSAGQYNSGLYSRTFSPNRPEIEPKHWANEDDQAGGNTMRAMLFIRSLGLTLGLLVMSAAAFAQVGVAVSITIAPPELPIYDQPVCPDEGYIWTPGYWAYGDDDYYWVPGTWVLAPEVGFLWTPGYWAWVDNGFVFYDGYWGPQVGFYGGISYGFGYFGHGYEGGRWDNGRFYYNRAVNNVNVTVIHNVYNTTVVNNTTVTRVSYNGGNGGVNERPRPEEEAAAHQRHAPPVAIQTQHVQAARDNPQLRATANHGKPPVAATPKPGALDDRAAVPAKVAGAVHTAAPRPENNAARSNTVVHPKDIPPAARPGVPNTGNAKVDQKYQQEQEKQRAKQDQERQRLQQKQDQDHQRLEQQKANDARKQQLEQQHQQQTQQLRQKHTQQQQKLQERQQPPPRPNPSKPPKEKP